MTAAVTIIADHPPNDGREWDAQCARCGSSVMYRDCYSCDEGTVEDEDYTGLRCDVCHGHGGWYVCGSGEDWCGEHPLAGRDGVECGATEWFVVADPHNTPRPTP